MKYFQAQCFAVDSEKLKVIIKLHYYSEKTETRRVWNNKNTQNGCFDLMERNTMEGKLQILYVNTSQRGMFSSLLFHYTNSQNSGAVLMETITQRCEMEEYFFRSTSDIFITILFRFNFNNELDVVSVAFVLITKFWVETERRQGRVFMSLYNQQHAVQEL